MEFLSERILRLAGLGGEAQPLNEGLAEEPVQTHQPYTTDETIESKFHSDDDEDKDVNEINVDYAIRESREALVESRLRDAIRQELKAMLAESDEEADTEEGNEFGAPGYKQVKRTGRAVSMGGVGVGFKNWKN
tara:strand:- start:8505 stop:8906 length:402 start_codon:yes stop_codon:yes gene_type:complete